MEAPFTEKREWTDCDNCRCNEKGTQRLPVDGLTNCPECGQPPRCTWWHESRDGGRCDRIASVDPLGTGTGTCCGQHHVNSEVSWHIEEAQFAQKWMKSFLGQAKLIGNEYVEECFDLAWAHSEMLLQSQIKAQKAIWSDR